MNEGVIVWFDVRETTGYSVTHVDCFTGDKSSRDDTEGFTVGDGCPYLTCCELLIGETYTRHRGGTIRLCETDVKDVRVMCSLDIDGITCLYSSCRFVVTNLNIRMLWIFINPICTIIHEEMVREWSIDRNVRELVQLHFDIRSEVGSECSRGICELNCIRSRIVHVYYIVKG